MESNEKGFSLDTSGNVITIGLMIGSTIADIESKLPAPVAHFFRESIKDAYRRGCEKSAEDETAAGCTQSE